MTYVLALSEVDFCWRWHVVCYGMPTNKDFKFLKKIYGSENLKFTSDYKIVDDLTKYYPDEE